MLKIFSVYDSKAEAYLTPIFVPNAAVAVRSFVGAATNPESAIFANAEDFELWELGEWDPGKGTFVETKKVSLGLASDFKAAHYGGAK